jgi:uncharacterized membrane protein YfcA
LALPAVSLAPFLAETIAIATGAVVAAWVGAGWLKAVSGPALARLIFILLVTLGLGLLVEAGLSFASDGFLASALPVRLVAGLFFGFLIGAISSILGVAGGEVIIPTLVFGYGVPIKTAGSLSVLISLPTVLTGIARHARAGSFADRLVMRDFVVPMALASALGAVIGSVLAIYVASGLIKTMLGSSSGRRGRYSPRTHADRLARLPARPRTSEENAWKPALGITGLRSVMGSSTRCSC